MMTDQVLTRFYVHRWMCTPPGHSPAIASKGNKTDCDAKIGTGLFVGSGATLSTVGPAPFFMAFIVMSVIIWSVMNALAEMTTYLPVQGASAPFYINHFFEPSLAFAAGISTQTDSDTL